MQGVRCKLYGVRRRDPTRRHGRHRTRLFRTGAGMSCKSKGVCVSKEQNTHQKSAGLARVAFEIRPEVCKVYGIRCRVSTPPEGRAGTARGYLGPGPGCDANPRVCIESVKTKQKVAGLARVACEIRPELFPWHNPPVSGYFPELQKRLDLCPSRPASMVWQHGLAARGVSSTARGSQKTTNSHKTVVPLSSGSKFQ